MRITGVDPLDHVEPRVTTITTALPVTASAPEHVEVADALTDADRDFLLNALDVAVRTDAAGNFSFTPTRPGP